MRAVIDCFEEARITRIILSLTRRWVAIVPLAGLICSYELLRTYPWILRLNVLDHFLDTDIDKNILWTTTSWFLDLILFFIHYSYALFTLFLSWLPGARCLIFNPFLGFLFSYLVSERSRSCEEVVCLLTSWVLCASKCLASRDRDWWFFPWQHHYPGTRSEISLFHPAQIYELVGY